MSTYHHPMNITHQRVRERASEPHATPVPDSHLSPIKLSPLGAFDINRLTIDVVAYESGQIARAAEGGRVELDGGACLHNCRSPKRGADEHTIGCQDKLWLLGLRSDKETKCQMRGIRNRCSFTGQSPTIVLSPWSVPMICVLVAEKDVS